MTSRLPLILVIVIMILAIFFACSNGEKMLTASEILDLGEKYLLELNYEQAVLQFLKVIEIEPMNPRGYSGAAEAYQGLYKIDKAVEILELGFERTGSNQIKQILDKINSDTDSLRNTTNPLNNVNEPVSVDGDSFGIGLGYASIHPSNSFSYNGVEYVRINSFLFAETKNGLEKVNLGGDYYFNSEISLTGNWIYGVGYYEGMEREGEGEYIVRYNMSSKEWDTVSLISDEQYVNNYKMFIYDDNIYYEQRDDYTSSYYSIWRMDINGNNKQKLTTFQITNGICFVYDGYIYYNEHVNYESAANVPDYIKDTAYHSFGFKDSWFGWGQIYRMDINGNNIQQVSNKNLEKEIVASLEGIEDSTYLSPTFEATPIPYENYIYYFDGTILWKTLTGSSISEIVWYQKNYSEAGSNGGREYIWDGSFSGESPDIFKERKSKIYGYDHNKLVIMIVEYEYENINDSFYPINSHVIDYFVFDPATETITKENIYKKITENFIDRGQFTLLAATKDYIYGCQDFGSVDNSDVRYIQVNRVTEETTIIGDLQTIDDMPMSYNPMP